MSENNNKIEQLDELTGKGKLNDIIRYHNQKRSEFLQKRKDVSRIANMAEKEGIKVDPDSLEDKEHEHEDNRAYHQVKAAKGQNLKAIQDGINAKKRLKKLKNDERDGNYDDYYYNESNNVQQDQILDEGAWGHSVVQNDTFLDYLSDYQDNKTYQIDHKKVSNKIHSNIEKLHDKFKRSKNTFDKDDYSHAIMAGAHAAHSVGFKLNKSHKQAVNDAVSHLSGREASEYDEPSLRRKNLKNFLRKINEEEQLDEISKKTLGSYVRKAADNLALKAHEKGKKEAQTSSLRAVIGTIRSNQTSDLEKKLGLDYKTVSKEEDKIYKRIRGIDKATNRLTKEQSMNENEFLDESEASDTLAPNSIPVNDPKSRFEVIQNVLGALAEVDNETLAKFNDLAIASRDNAKVDDDSAKNRASVAMKEETKKEFVSLFNEETLTEEAKEKVTTLFEAAVSARVTIETARLEEQYEQELQEQLTESVEQLTDNVDSYLTYAVEQYFEDNELAITAGIKNQINEEFIAGLRDLFIEHNINIPDEQIEVVEELADKIDEQEKTIADLINKNKLFEQEIAKNSCKDLISEMSSGLNVVQTDKFNKLAETVEFSGDINSYKTKLLTIKEGVLNIDNKNKPSSGASLVEQTNVVQTTPVDSDIDAISKALSRMAPKR